MSLDSRARLFGCITQLCHSLSVLPWQINLSVLPFPHLEIGENNFTPSSSCNLSEIIDVKYT